ncbi:cyclic nucleotide gated channel 1 [Wolffia australiana]
MSFGGRKFVRFEDWNSERSPSFNSTLPARSRKVGLTSEIFLRISGWVLQILNFVGSCVNPWHSPEDQSHSEKKILDPQGYFLQRWNKIFVLSCVLAVAVDPLFFYIPIINDDEKCLGLEKKLAITASVLRSFTDIFYIIHILFQFRTGYIAPSSRVFGRGVLVEDSYKIAQRYLSSYFIVDILAVLPIPQVIILLLIRTARGEATWNAKNLLIFVVIFQYIPRLVRIIPLYREVTRTSGIITQTAWAGAAFNLVLYILASHVLGAVWYLLSVERKETCWRNACRDAGRNCKQSFVCGNTANPNNFFLNSTCPINPANETLFDFGIYLPALQNVVDISFVEKLFYCLWWGLRNLSSLGQNLKTSTFAWENTFAVFISISGLVLFALLIGNMQTYLQSTTVRIEEMRVKRRDTDQWMSHRMLTDKLRERIRRHEQYRWQVTRGVNEELLLQNLPKDLRRDIKRHLCLNLLNRVPMFEKMDDQLMDAMLDRLKPALYTGSSHIVREGDPVEEMLFIMRGKLESATTNGGRSGFLNTESLKGGDFCGEELLTWALDPHPNANLPSSTRTVKALTEVEAFALKAEDLKLVASQFRRLHSKQLRHTFRFCSHLWRAWAACVIQAAWRRFTRRKMEEALRVEEDQLRAALRAGGGGGAPSFGAALYASRFAAHALRNVRRVESKKGGRVPVLLLQKPAEPDFSAEEKR